MILRQALLPEDLRPVVSLEALQGEEVERPAAESRLVLLRPGPGESSLDFPDVLHLPELSQSQNSSHNVRKPAQKEICVTNLKKERFFKVILGKYNKTNTLALAGEMAHGF